MQFNHKCLLTYFEDKPYQRLKDIELEEVAVFATHVAAVHQPTYVRAVHVSLDHAGLKGGANFGQRKKKYAISS